MYLLFINVANASRFDTFVSNATKEIINPIIQLLFVLAFALFFYGVTVYLVNPEAEEKRTQGKQHMLWGLIGLTIMFSVWAILNILINTFGITGIDPQSGTVNLPD